MSRQLGSLHRSISHPANLQNNLPIIPLFAFPPPQSPHDDTSSSMESDTNSNTTVYITISQFNNSDIETADKFANSEPSPSTLSQPPFQHIPSQVKIEPPSPPSSISIVTPIYFPLTSEPSDNNDSENTQISHQLYNFMTLQQQLQHPQTLTIHQLSQFIISSNTSTPPPLHIIPNLKAQLLHQPHPPVQRRKTHYVNEHVLYLTLSWTSFDHFTNPLSLPLYNTLHDNEVCSTQLYLLTTALIPNQFTQIGYRQSLIKITAPKSNDYSIDFYDLNIIRPNEDIFLKDSPFANPQLTEKFFIKTPYIFTLNTLNKNTTTSFQQHSVIIMLMIHTLTNLTTFHKLFVSSHPKNVICTVHTMSWYELNKDTRTLTTSSSSTITLLIHQHDNFTIDIITLTLNTPHHFFLTLPIV